MIARTRPLLRPALVLAAVAALAAGCVPGSGQATLPPASPTAEPSVAPSSPDVTPDPPSPTPSAQPSSPAPASPTVKPSAPATPSPTAPAETTVVRAYFFLEDPVTGDPGLVAVLREVPATKAVATAAIRELLAGPSSSERTARPAIVSTIPAGTRLLGISIEGRVATIDLSREFGSGGGSESMFGRLAQVVYTLTQFSTVDEVAFMLDGEPVAIFGGEGIMLDGPVGRADFREQLPEIFVDRPVWGAAAGNPARVTGLTRVFEATFQVQLLDREGRVLTQQTVMATCGTGCWGTFDVTLRYDVPKAQWGALRVFDLSARDGSEENVRSYPVWLTPAD